MIASNQDIVPHDPTVEKNVLGLLIDATPQTRQKIFDRTSPADFFTPVHADLARVIQDMHRNGTPIDLATVRAACRDKELLARLSQDGQNDERGGEEFLLSLCEYASIESSAAYIAGLLAEKSKLRRLISLGDTLSRQAREGDADAEELAAGVQTEILEIATRETKRGAVQLGDAVCESIARAEAVARGEESPGLPTGFDMIDRATGGGMQPGDLWVVGAGTSVGKTALALTIAGNVADAGRPVLFWSGEMPAASLANRLLSARSEIPALRLRAGNLHEQEHRERETVAREISGWRFSILDKPATVGDIGLHARMLSHRWGCPPGLIVVDYLQLVTPGRGDNRHLQVSAIAWGLKELAMSLPCTVLLLSQLNRAGVREATDAQPPTLHSLKESGDIENHANVVLLLHRPNEQSNEPEIWGKIAKARDGITTSWPMSASTGGRYPGIRFRFIPECVRFEDMSCTGR